MEKSQQHLVQGGGIVHVYLQNGSKKNGWLEKRDAFPMANVM